MEYLAQLFPPLKKNKKRLEALRSAPGYDISYFALGSCSLHFRFKVVDRLVQFFRHRSAPLQRTLLLMKYIYGHVAFVQDLQLGCCACTCSLKLPRVFCLVRELSA
jgi:hypothetical protein